MAVDSPPMEIGLMKLLQTNVVYEQIAVRVNCPALSRVTNEKACLTTNRRR